LVPIQIIEGCKRKEQDSFRDCYHICAPYVYSIVKQYVSDQSWRKDAMQETFAQIFFSIDNYNSKLGQFKSWISTIAVRQSINVLRKNNYLKDIQPITDDNNYSESIIPKLNELSYNAFQSLIFEMPIGYKTIVLLYYIEGYTHNEISSILDISVNTSKSQLNRGLVWLNKNVGHKLKEYIHG